jgi:hypothetical protein
MAINQITGGGFQDSEGNPLAEGTLVLTLNRDAYTDNTFTTLVCAGQALEIALDENGNIAGAKYAWPNDQLIDVWTLAADTFYTAKAFTAEGQLAWGPNVMYIGSTPSPSVITSIAPINPSTLITVPQSGTILH